jgi:tetratricopeptide (TPR) repeat protein
MEKTTFYNQLSTKQPIISDSQVKELATLQADFPYFTLASMLYVKALKINKDKSFQTVMRQSATRVMNRAVLFDFVFPEYASQQAELAISDSTVKQAPESPKISSTSTPQSAQPIVDKAGNTLQSKADLMEQVKKRLQEVEEERKSKLEVVKEIDQAPKTETKPTAEQALKTEAKQEVKPAVKQVEKAEVKQEVATPKALPKEIEEEKPEEKQETTQKVNAHFAKPIDRGSNLNIIEKFIKTNPEINKPEDKEYQLEMKIAKQSLDENLDIVTETMAVLFAKQGHAKKAIKIYQKLMLLNPEKSSYFAARISELEN